MGDCMGAKNGNHWMTKEGLQFLFLRVIVAVESAIILYFHFQK